MRFVCPKLEVWFEIYSKAKALIPSSCPPPPPCTDRWSSLSDEAKQLKWSLMVNWLESHGIECFVEELCDSDWYITGVQYINNDPRINPCPYGRDPRLK
jgi:hypothetical protein